MKEAREVEFEVLTKEERPGTALNERDPMVAFVARMMDTVFSIPGTKIRFGLDPILGLIPGLGDTASAAVSVMLILQSARYGVPKVVLARMALNVLLNTAVGAIPILGDLFSVWFKSNAKNYDLLRLHAGAQRKSTARDWIFVAGLLTLLIGGIVLLIVGAVSLIGAAFRNS